MAVSAQLSPKIAIGGFNWTSNSNALDWGVEAAVLDITTWDYIPFTNSTMGLKALSFSATAFQDHAGATSLAAWLRANHGSQQVVSLAPTGDVSSGVAVIARGVLAGAQRFVNSAVGQVPQTVATIGDGVVAEGLVTQSTSVLLSVTAQTDAANIGALTSGRTVYGAVHVLSVTGSATFQLKSSPNGLSSWSNRGSAGAAMSAAGAQWFSYSTATTDAYWAFDVTIATGPATVFAVLALA